MPDNARDGWVGGDDTDLEMMPHDIYGPGSIDDPEDDDE